MYIFDKLLADEKRIGGRASAKDWGGRIAVGLVYPNSYHAGMSSLGYQTLYGLLNGYDKLTCERIFFDRGDSYGVAEGGKALPVSLESGRKASQFDVVAFTVSYELDYFNVVQVLRNAGIPLLAEERDERHPLVIGGGPCIIANPEPVAPFFDCLAIGEAEAVLPPLVALLESELSTSKRPDLLQQLSKLPGVYVPLLMKRADVGRVWSPDLDAFATTSVILTPNTEFKNMYLMEVERGCNRGCKFCLAGNAFRPVRFRSLQRLLDMADAGLRHTDRLGLVGPSVLSHPDGDELVGRLREKGAKLSFSSLALDGLTDEIVRAVVESGTRTITLAPETGSEALRLACNKGYSDEAVLSAVSMAARHHVRQMKLYFMIGLPGETDEDAVQIARLANECLSAFPTGGRAVQMTLDINPFIPKMGTAFQGQPMASGDVLKERLRAVRQRVSKGIQVKAESVEWSRVQALLSTGDRSLAKVLASLEKQTIHEWQKHLPDASAGR